jgi:hypothetical protein
MSSEVFKARVALHSWDNAPFFPDGTAQRLLEENADEKKAAASEKRKTKKH